MTIAEKIFELWGAEPTAIALVPAARFKLSGIYQGLAFPHVIYQRIFSSRYSTIHEGARNTFDRETWQISIHVSGNAADSSAEIIRQKIISVFDGHHDGFNFFYRNAGPTIVSQDRQYLMLPVEFLIFSTT